MSREPIPTWFFVLVVVRRGDRFLVVHERKHGGGWYLPAGRVEPGESFVAAARRETMEEAGIEVRLTGVLRIEHTPMPIAARVRVVLVAEPVDDTPPKQEPDEETLGARWASRAELASLPLRSDDVLRIFRWLELGTAVVAPLSILGTEGDEL